MGDRGYRMTQAEENRRKEYLDSKSVNALKGRMRRVSGGGGKVELPVDMDKMYEAWIDHMSTRTTPVPFEEWIQDPNRGGYPGVTVPEDVWKTWLAVKEKTEELKARPWPELPPDWAERAQK